MNVMLSSLSRGKIEDDQNEDDINLDLESDRPQRKAIPVSQNFRSILNTNSRENSDVTIETVRMNNEENMPSCWEKKIKSKAT